MRRGDSLWVIAALGAGLMTGLSRFLDPVVAGTIFLMLAVALRRHAAWALPVAALAGAALGGLTRFHDAGSCAARLPRGAVELTARLTETPIGGAARVEPVDAGCHGNLRVRLPEGAPHEPGTVLRIAGRWIPRETTLRPSDGLLVGAPVRVTPGTPSPGEWLRGRAAASSARLFGSRAGVVDALILGRREGMDLTVRESFAQAGLVHLLAISGFHVGLLASWVILLLQAAGVRRQRAWVVGAAAAVGYVALLGWPAPATRAAWLTVLAALGMARQRAVQRSALLATACLGVMIVDPWAVFNLGAWLSVASIAGLAAATRWSDRALGSGWGWRMLSASVGSTLATAPLTAAILGAVAPIGIALNFVAIPLAAVAIPGVLLSVAADQFLPGVAATLAAGSGLALAGLEELARAGAAVPGGHLVLEPAWGSALPWLVVAALGWWGIAGGSTTYVALRRWGTAAAIGCWLLVARDGWPRGGDDNGSLTLHFLDVGQGDAAAIRTPAGRWVLVDAGPADGRIDAGRRVVAPYLLRRRVAQLDVALVSHAHADHLGGLPSVLSRIPAAVVLEPGMAVPDPGYRGFLDWVATTEQRWRGVRRGDRFVLDGVEFAFLLPDTTWAGWGLDLNENSAVVRVRWGRFTALLTGDAGFPAESLLAGAVGRVDLLKVGHHGSRGSSGAAFLSETAPAVAIISAGRNNRHGHPAPAALARLAEAGVEVYRTDRDGTVEVTVHPASMTIRGAGGVRNFSLPP